MNLTIKDLSTSVELDRAAMAAVHGGSQGNSAVSTIGQLQNVYVPTLVGSGAGSSGNVDVDVDASQYATIDTYQNNGDKFKFDLGYFPKMLG